MFRKKRSIKGFAAVSEFVLALGVIFVGLVPPFIDLMSMAVSYGFTQLIVRRAAARAANASSFDNALSEMQTEVLSLNGTPLARFCKLQPTGGYNGCGVDLYIKETNIYTNKTTVYGPNTTLSAADPTSNIYECTAQASYQVSPLISMSMIPFYSSIEGVGQPFSFGTAWNVALEHPQLLDTSTSAYSSGSSGSGSSNAAIPSSGPLTSWNFPYYGTYAASPGQIEQTPTGVPWVYRNVTEAYFMFSFVSPPTPDPNDFVYVNAGQRISFQMLTPGGPDGLWLSISADGPDQGQTEYFQTHSNELNITVPVSGYVQLMYPIAHNWWLPSWLVKGWGSIYPGSGCQIEMMVTN